MPDRENRDRAVERLLPQVLGGAPSTECVDGETLAAWTDGTLRQSDAARVEQHVADCARCQALLGAFVRISPPAVVTPSLWQRLRLGWLLPLATAAAAVALWAVIPETRFRPESQVSLAEPRRDTPAAATPPAAIPQPAPALPSVPERERATLAAPPPTEADRSTRPERRDADDSRQRSTDTLAKQERAEALADAQSKRRADENTPLAKPSAAEGRKVAAEPPLPPPPSPPAPAPAIVLPATPAPAAPVAGTAGGAISARARATEQKPSSNATLARPVPLEERAADLALKSAFAAPIEIATPLASTRWRIVGGARVERTTDNGGRWDAIALPDGVAAQLTAGSAPSADVCWIVGRAGQIYVTIDGRRFTRLTFPEPVDLVSVRATDARTATVTTVDGRSFQTTDGGAGWTR